MPRGRSENAKTARTPPYTSYRTFRTFIQDLHELGVPSRIDRSVLTRFSGVVGMQLTHALRFLGLIEDEGRPTQRLRELVNAEDEGRWRESLLELLRREYAPLFTIDLESATPSHFNDTFRRAFPAADAVVQKCVTFFLYAAHDAGLRISGRVLKGRKPRSSTPRRKHPPPLTQEFGADPRQSQPDGSRIDGRKPSEILLLLLEPNEMDDEQQDAVWTLLKYFRAKGL